MSKNKEDIVLLIYFLFSEKIENRHFSAHMFILKKIYKKYYISKAY